ncbi:type 1 glutamine amidotransferase domain-containing protein [Aestuariirhabdus haliotis]|uniref:type 1 glutamine amidotransferase domain-containing protein n=1 Tax=Aestuariirhabdus haliotis TaxID=2918751 RepID=UPI0020C02959|nr:type 1 glutamine amidotransferase domain-containing protein [Aestuariirhabdus haliotis]MCL6418136.1 type 1 glutamine amidotransferase domain-containing protein [Aestuariirhabdus haliotis]
MSNAKVLMVLTSHDQLGNSGEKTGFWVEEFAAPYYVFLDAGAEVILASPSGGQPPIDPKSELDDFQTDATRRFASDKAGQQALANTLPLAQVNADDFDAVFYPGGHGPLWDLTDNPQSIALLEAFVDSNKPVSAVCHATAALLNVKQSGGDLLVKNRAVTGFSNSEEAAVELTEVVPFLLEDALKERQADYQCAADWHPFAIQDGLMITGQNPASSELVAQKLLAHLSA